MRILARFIMASIIMAAMLVIVLVTVSGPYEEAPEREAEPPPPPPPLEVIIPPGTRSDRDFGLYVQAGEETVVMSMEMYLIGVVAAEMPAGFPLEALKAQAVAARTMVLYHTFVQPKAQHPSANACTDYACCMAFSQDDALRERWAGDYYENIMRIINAVIETDGTFMSYGGEPILAVFHSSSAGKTESSGNVWVTDLPYLTSVESPEAGSQVPNFETTVTVPRSEFAETIIEAFPEAVFDEDGEPWITDLALTESGRVFDLFIGGVYVRGTELRSLFNLRSTAFTMEWRGDTLTFRVAGYGHGVGMSQYGAASMAVDGMLYRDILRAYYTGISFSDNALSLAQ